MSLRSNKYIAKTLGTNCTSEKIGAFIVWECSASGVVSFTNCKMRPELMG